MEEWVCSKCGYTIEGINYEDVLVKAEKHMKEHESSTAERIRRMFSIKKKEEDLEDMA